MGAKERNKKYVLDIAKMYFLENGIVGVSVIDIARKADVGTASIYRYFDGKNALIIEAAVSMWKERLVQIKRVYDKNIEQSGFEQLKCLTKFFPWSVIHDEKFSQFLVMLDALLINGEISAQERKMYDEVMIEIYRIFEKAYNTGREDGTVREISDFANFYFAGTQAILSMSQKLMMRGNIVSTDTDMADKINLIIELLTNYFDAKR